MNDLDKRQRMEAFGRLCRETGLRSTLQRRIILESVLDLENHPSADDVFELVNRRVEGISRTTVYRTLEKLARIGAITKACHPGRVARYDRRTGIHHHLICLRCESISDYSDEVLDSIELPDTSGIGFEVEDYRVQLRGVCRDCRERAEKEELE